ncbi:MAG: helix-turn-helix transcriptional regulator [Emergencia sp.]
MENRLKELREQKGISQEELSKISGVSRTIISYIETKKDVDVKLKTLVALARALDKKVSEIFLV